MKKRRPAHQTQWAAQFAVGSELCRRNYQVALTLGNHPETDLMVVSPEGTQFLVDVKGQHILFDRGRFVDNPWPVSPKKKRERILFYIFASVPDPQDGEVSFTVMTEGEVNEHIEANTRAWRARNADRENRKDPMPSVSGKFVQEHHGGWPKLPQ